MEWLEHGRPMSPVNTEAARACLLGSAAPPLDLAFPLAEVSVLLDLEPKPSLELDVLLSDCFFPFSFLHWQAKPPSQGTQYIWSSQGMTCILDRDLTVPLGCPTFTRSALWIRLRKLKIQCRDCLSVFIDFTHNVLCKNEGLEG